MRPRTLAILLHLRTTFWRISAALTVLAGLAFVNNLVAAWRWYALIRQGVLDMAPQGFIRWLNFTAVDMSTVSTFIPFYGLIFITRALKRIGEPGVLPDYYPFTRSYDRITVSLGLIGTLWGIIMLGYYPPNSVSMPNLITCLHTALYSTLVAVVWVFVVVVVVRKFIRWYHREVCRGMAQEGEEDLIELFTELEHSVSSAGKSLMATNQEVAAFAQRLAETRNEFGDVLEQLRTFKQRAGIDVYEHIEGVCGRIQSALTALHAEAAQLQARSDGFERMLTQIGGVLEQKAGILETFGRHLEQVTAERAAAHAQVQALLASCRACEERLHEAGQRISELAAAKQQAEHEAHEAALAARHAEERAALAREAQAAAEQAAAIARAETAAHLQRVLEAHTLVREAEQAKACAEHASAQAHQTAAYVRAEYDALMARFNELTTRLARIQTIAAWGEEGKAEKLKS